MELLADVTPAMVNDIIHKECSGQAQASRHNYRRTVSKVFNALITESSFRGQNPVASSRKVPLTRQQAQRDVWIPADHLQRRLAAAGSSGSPLRFHDMVELNWELALRIDEMLTLEWHQIDFGQRLLKIVEKSGFPTQFGLGWSPK